MTVHQDFTLQAYRTSLRQNLLNVALKFGRGVSRTGTPYEWMLDTRELLLQGPHLHHAARLLWAQLKAYRPHVVAGMTLAANPLTIALMYESRADGQPVDAVIIRKERKADGLRKLVEGPELRPETRVVLVDDLVNSGDTQRRALAALAPSQCQVVALGVVVDYQRPGALALRSEGYPIESLFSFQELGMAARPPARGTLTPRWVWGPLNNGVYDAPKSTPWVGQGRVVVGSDQGFLVCLSDQGEELWRSPVRDTTRGIHGAPAVSGDRVYVGAYDGILYCLDLETGRVVWTSRYCEWIGSSPTVSTEHGLVYVGIERGAREGGLMAVAVGTGQLAWELPARRYTHSSPLFDTVRHQVVVGSNDHFLYAADAKSGMQRWQFETRGPIKGRPAVDDEGTLFCASMDGCVYAVDAASGVRRWARRLASALYFSPLVVDDAVIVGGYSHRIVALARSNGAVRWVTTTGGRLVGGAALLPSGHVAVASTDGVVYVLSAADGREQWTYRTQGPIRGTPGVGDGLLVVPSCDGSLYAFDTTHC
jgi:outer membrane protein assembly factor BamB/adenine/guanine phosphoribosyltransferase-like PRPP-binding protein